MDMFIVNGTYVKKDIDFVQNQGGTDVFQNLGGASDTEYMVALYKRKFKTGDNNRDINVTNGNNVYCVYLGTSWNYINFTYDNRICLPLVVNTSYYKNFRISDNTNNQSNPINYVQPPNTVKVVTWEPSLLTKCIFLSLIIIINVFYLY